MDQLLQRNSAEERDIEGAAPLAENSLPHRGDLSESAGDADARKTYPLPHRPDCERGREGCCWGPGDLGIMTSCDILYTSERFRNIHEKLNVFPLF